MGFSQAIRTCFSKSFVCTGRAARSEFWYFMLFQYILYLLLYFVLAHMIILSNNNENPDFLTMVIMVFLLLTYLVTFPAGFCVTIRRLHDVGKSGYYWLFAFLPIIGGLYLLYLTCLPSEDGDNRYGLSPLTDFDNLIP